MVELSGLSDQQLADRYARCDLRLREMLHWTPLMDKFDALLSEMREEMDRRRTEGDG
jgi:hypothetical protein